MIRTGERTARTAAALLSLLLGLLTASVLTAPVLAGPLDLGTLGAAVVVVLVAAVLLRGTDVLALGSASGQRGPDDDERQLRGSFRRQSSPDTAGRPRPRAPGTGLRPA